MAKRRKRAAAKPADQPHRFASIYPGLPPHPTVAEEFAISVEIVDAVSKLEAEIRLPVWLLVQDEKSEERGFGRETYNFLGDLVAAAFFRARHADLPKK